jgi:lipoprotein-anchoring transpeptidase ErfK/SrfK
MDRQSGGRLSFAAAIVMSVLAPTLARADVVVQIDKSAQRMAVSIDRATWYNSPVYTGRSCYGTPSGVFHP